MKISIIIPVLNEEAILASSLSRLCDEHNPDEIIISDGGSLDGSQEIARSYGKLVQTSRGRARQMNEGAAQAEGDVLLFLHADTHLPKDALPQIRQAIQNGALAGRFRLQFDHKGLLLRLYASYTRFHSFSYGDQAYFIRRGLFEEMEGFDLNAAFEDIDFYRRLLARTKPVILKSAVITSARRFLKVGCIKQKWINLFLLFIYYAGFDVQRFKPHFYSDIR